MSDLPSGWTIAEIGDLLHGITAGKNLKCEERPPQAHERGVIKVSAVTWGTFDASQSKTLPRTFEPAPDTAIKASDFLFSRANTLELVGAVVLVKNDHPNLFLSDKVLRLDLQSELKPWLLVYLQSIEGRRKLGDVSSGNQMSMRNIGQSSLKSVLIPLPPLNEQRRIVAKIEELFSELDKGVESLKLARAQLRLYRQSVLKHAFEGKLTADWREANPDKLEDPETLLARIQAERDARYKQQLDDWNDAVAAWRANGEEGRKPSKQKHPKDLNTDLADIQIHLPELPQGWLWQRLGFGTCSPEYGTSAKSAETGAVPVIRMGNLQMGVIDWDDLVFTSDEEEIEKYRLRQDDVLFNRTNSPELVGKTAIYRGEREALFAGYLIRLNQVETTVSAQYATYFLNSHIAQQHGNTVKTDGVNQSNINGNKLQSYPFPYCSLEEQAVVVIKLDELLSNTSAAMAEIDTQLEKSEALRQSILKQAFSGQLVPQDSSDEPASALLERIKAAKTTAKKPRRRRTAA